MKTLLLSLLSLFVIDLIGQVTFSDPEVLFNHPLDRPGTENPLVPLDFNRDGITDFVGHVGESFFDNHILYITGNDQGGYDIDSLSTGGGIAPFAQVTNFLGTGTFDILFGDRILINVDRLEMQIPLPDNYDPFVTFDSYLKTDDFNGDGASDVVVRRTISGDDNELGVYLSIPGVPRTYTNTVLETLGDIADADVVDINLDGLQDIVIVELDEIDATSINIYLSNGDGTFETNSISTFDFFLQPNFFADLEMRDFDNDGDVDIIYADDLGGITFLENDGSLNFTLVNGGTSPVDIFLPATYAVGDISQDGLDDLVVLEGNGILSFVENMGDFMFADPIELGDYNDPFFIYTVDRFFDVEKLTNNLNLYDFDSDGDLDVLYLDGVTGEEVLIRSNVMSSSVTDVEDNHLEVYPNPSDDYFNVSSENLISSISVYSSDGQMIGQYQVDDYIYNLDLRDVDSGIYNLAVKFQDRYVNRFIVKD